MKLAITQTSYFLALIFFLLTIQVQANDDFNFSSGNQLKATVEAEYGVIDNFLQSHDSKERTSYLKLTPSMFMQTQLDQILVQFDAKTESYQYNQFSGDDHTNYSVAPNLYYKLDHNKTFYLKAKSEQNFESRGSYLTIGNADSVERGDKKSISDISGGYLYGSDNSVAKLTLNVFSENERYNTRREETYLLDNRKSGINASFDYLLSGKSYIAVDVGYTQTDFENDAARNEDVLLLLAGLKWEISSVTKIGALLGYQEITFEEGLLKSDNSFKWKVNFDWDPSYETKVNFISERSFQSANRLSNSYRVSDVYGLKLNQKFTDYFNITAGITFSDDSIFTGIVEDSEEYLSTSIKFLYIKNQWLKCYVDYKYQKLASNYLIAEYQQNQFGFGVQISLQ